MLINFVEIQQLQEVNFVFYDRFVELCKKKNISPSKAAGEIGFNKSSISNWKKNGYTPRKEIAVKIAEYFGVSVDYLMTGEEPEGKPEVTEHDLKVALFHGDKEVTDEMWKEVMDFAEMVALKYRYKKNDDNKS